MPRVRLRLRTMDLDLNPHAKQRIAELARESASSVPMFTKAELNAAGVDEPIIRSLVVEGRLVRHDRGIYAPRLEGTPDPMTVRIRAHNAAASGGTHVYTHTSAARIWGLSVWRTRPLVHVAHASRRGDGGPSGDVVRHNQRIPEREVRVVDGLRVTSLERTIIDCARLLPFEQAMVIADSGLAHRADTDWLQRLVVEGKATRGIRKVREILRLADGRAESRPKRASDCCLPSGTFQSQRCSCGFEPREAACGWISAGRTEESSSRCMGAPSTPITVLSIGRWPSNGPAKPGLLRQAGAC